MRIAVIAPHMHSNGATTLAMMIGLAMSSTGRTTCITHVKPISESFYKYLNFIGYQDKTSTPSQIVKILKEGGLSKDDVIDYCKRVAENIEAFTNDATNFSQADMNYMINYMAKSFPHEHVVFDVDDNDIKQNTEVIKISDVVVLNITQSVAELRRFYENKDEYMKMFEGKPLIVVVNKYNSVKGTLKETANWMGVKKPNSWLVFHENPWVAWSTNHGQLNQLYKKIQDKDTRVIELNSDLSKIVGSLVRAKVSKDKKSGGGKR